MANSRAPMPQTVEAYKKLAARDLELIEEQRDEISRLKAKNNKLEQKTTSLRKLINQIKMDLIIRSDEKNVVNLSDGLWRKLKQLTDPTIG